VSGAIAGGSWLNVRSSPISVEEVPMLRRLVAALLSPPLAVKRLLRNDHDVRRCVKIRRAITGRQHQAEHHLD